MYVACFSVRKPTEWFALGGCFRGGMLPSGERSLYLAWGGEWSVMGFDTVIRGGRWFDGTGAPSAVRNIGIRDGHVVVISPQALDDTDCLRVIDATGKLVLPG